MVDYFFSGGEYIPVTRGGTGHGTVDSCYPRPNSVWNWGAFGANGIDAGSTECSIWLAERILRAAPRLSFSSCRTTNPPSAYSEG